MNRRLCLVDDDDDDVSLILEALEEAAFESENIKRMHDGQELVEYLREIVESSGDGDQKLPALILLDLNMPRLSGKEALHKIRQDSRIKHLPVVVLTTSENESDVLDSYRLGASYVVKPDSFSGFVRAANKISDYWFNLVALPSKI